MNTGFYVFAQLIKLLPKEAFDWIVKQYDGDKYVKHFTYWNQLLVMMFGQLYGCERLRELVSMISVHSKKAYHLGFGKEEIKLANLAKANANRDCRILRGSLIGRTPIREQFERPVDGILEICNHVGFQLSFNF